MSKSSRIFDGLKTNVSYSFYIRAKNSMGVWSDISDVVTHSTVKDVAAPGAPTGLLLITRPGMFMFNWTQATEIDIRGGGYRLYVYTSNTPASAKLLKSIGYTSEWAVVMVGDKTDDSSITINNGVTYWFWLTTLDDSGNESGKTAFTPASALISEWDWRRLFLLMGV